MKRRLLLSALFGLIVLTGTLGLVSSGSASSPGSYIYWTRYGAHAIGRANLDGTGVNQSLVTGTDPMWEVAVDADHVYWTTAGDGTVGRANLDGTGIDENFITGGVYGVAVDGGHVYWTDGASIGRANLDGTGANPSFITGGGDPRGIAVDAGHVYWTNSTGNSIGRANLDGTGVDQNFITAANAPEGVAFDAGHVYWTNLGTNSIGRANLDGTGVNENFITGAHYPQGVAVDAGYVYWTNNATNSIGRANLDGTAVNQSFISGASGAWGIAVSGEAQSHSAAYDGNGATGGSAPSDGSSPYVFGATVTVLDPGSLARTHYSFAGWNTQADGGGTSYQPGDVFSMPGSTVTLYAQWAINSYAVVYSGNGATSGSAPVDGSSPHVVGTTVTVLGAGSMRRGGHRFNGWNTQSNGGATSYQPGGTFSMPASAVTLYAQWATNLDSGTTRCNGIYAGTGVSVVVLAGSTCTLIPGTHVTGSVTVNPGGILHASGVRIDDNLIMSGSATVCGSRIGADVMATGGSFALGGPGCAGNKIGDYAYVTNDRNNVWVWGNIVINGLLVKHLTGGTASIVGNTVFGGLLVARSGPPVKVSGNHAVTASCVNNTGQTGSGNVAHRTNTCPH